MIQGEHEDTFLNPVQVGRMLSLNNNSVRRACDEGKIGHYRTPGGFYKIPQSEVTRILDERRESLARRAS